MGEAKQALAPKQTAMINGFGSLDRPISIMYLQVTGYYHEKSGRQATGHDIR